jgi:hypothetical protein
MRLTHPQVSGQIPLPKGGFRFKHLWRKILVMFEVLGLHQNRVR